MLKYDIRTGVSKIKTKTTVALSAIIMSAGGFGMAVAIPASSHAAGNSHSGFTTGDCISDVVYGNEPNMANGAPGGPAEQMPGTQAGNVLPSQSPGPFVTNRATGEVTKGSSVGDFMQAGINVPQLCNAAAH